MHAQANKLVAAHDDAPHRIHRNVLVLEHRRDLPVRTPQNGTQPCQQLLDLKWLDEIVVGSRIQTANPITELVTCCNDQRRRGVIARTHAAQHLQARPVGKPEIEQQRRIAMID
jgi:hypothetical protein